MTQDTHTASGTAIDRALDSFERRERGIPQARIAAELVAELRAALASAAAPAQQPGAYAALERLEYANDALCKLRTDEQYLSMIDSGQQEALAELDAARNAARAILRASHGQAPAQPDNSAVHLSHCNMGEHVGSCKYGDDDCPALRKAPAQAAPQQAAQGPAAYGETWDAELGRTAMRFVDRAGDVHPGIDDAETICAEFYKAMSDVIEKMPHVQRMQPSMSAPASQGDAQDAARWRWLSEHIQVAWNEGKFTSLVRIVSEQHRQSLNASVDRMMAGDWSDAARTAQEGK